MEACTSPSALHPYPEIVLGLDPGPVRSALVVYQPQRRRVLGKVLAPNDAILDNLRARRALAIHTPTILAVEMVACYGMAVGASVFETCVWIGRYIEAWQGSHEFVYRRSVKLHLCNSARAKDANIRQALLDKFGDGTRRGAMGTKSQPGPLYGFKQDLWAALGVAVTWAETNRQPIAKTALLDAAGA